MAGGASKIVNAINNLTSQGLDSNAEINQTYIDLTNIPSVSSKTYSGINQDLTENNYTVQSQSYIEAHDRITRYVFNLTNQYRPETELALSGTGSLPTVSVYTYGTLKVQAMYAVISGLEQCLNSDPIRSSDDGSSWVKDYYPETMASKVITSFKIGEATYTASDGTIQTMDVAPEIVDNRTFVPVRYLAYSLGVEESGVTWNAETQTVGITSNETNISLTIGDTTETVNGEPVQMDTAPYIKDGRTMLPARWIAEPLGSAVTWDEATQQVTIEIPQPQEQEQ